MSDVIARSSRPFDHLVFDLDDTLVDTTTLMVPHAMREAAIAMIDAGLNATLDECLEAREKHANEGSRGELFAHITQRFGAKAGADVEAVKRAGWQAFYGRRVTEKIDLFPGVRDLLRELATDYRLALVTAGTRDTQIEKIRLLRLETLFSDIRVVDPSCGEQKADAFAAIMRDTGSEPARYLSIGNRLDTDVIPARALGWKGCWVRYGEHAKQGPTDASDKPDFQIDHIKELAIACQL